MKQPVGFRCIFCLQMPCLRVLHQADRHVFSMFFNKKKRKPLATCQKHKQAVSWVCLWDLRLMVSGFLFFY